MTTYLPLSTDEICYSHYPEDAPYSCIQPAWLFDIDTTAVQFWIQPGVPDIKFYLELEQHIDIQNARCALGVRAFQQVSDIETMLDWVGIEGKIRNKVLTSWYQRTAPMHTLIERERPLMPSLALPYDFSQEIEVGYDSEQDGEYEADEEYDGNHEMADVDPIDPIHSSTDSPTESFTESFTGSSVDNVEAFTNKKNEVHQVQINQYRDNIVNSAIMTHNFWPMLNGLLIRDLTSLRLQIEQYCPHIGNDINWAFLLCEPCTDVSVMIYLYVTSVWHSRPSDKEAELAAPVIWSLAIQLRVIVPSEQVLRVVEHRTAASEIPGLLPINQWV